MALRASPAAAAGEPGMDGPGNNTRGGVGGLMLRREMACGPRETSWGWGGGEV